MKEFIPGTASGASDGDGAQSPSQQERCTPREGITYEVWFPFKREEYSPPPEEDGAPPSRPTWVPGWRGDVETVYRGHGEYDEKFSYAWDGDGREWRRVVSVHKPGPTYPERVFYVRQWVSPDGTVFGRTNLRMTTVQAFRNWYRGSKTAHLHEDRREHLDRSAALFAEAMAMARAEGPASTTRGPDAPGMNQNPTPSPSDGGR